MNNNYSCTVCNSEHEHASWCQEKLLEEAKNKIYDLNRSILELENIIQIINLKLAEANITIDSLRNQIAEELGDFG